MAFVKKVELSYGASDPLVLEVQAESLLGSLAGPPGMTTARAEECVAAAAPPEGPELSAHVVPGDRVVIALCGDVPELSHVVAAVTAQLARGNVSADCIRILHAGSTACGHGFVEEFDPTLESDTAYLAADEAGRPLHLARALVDADVVVAIGTWSFDASFGGRGLAGELWPAFGRRERQDELAADLARRGRRALGPWLAVQRTLTWQLGVASCLRLVWGRDGSLAGAAFGLPEDAARRAGRMARAWAPTIPTPADLAICTLSAGADGFGAVVRAVAAAARITRPDATICVATTQAPEPGPVVTRWRQGAALRPLVGEARVSGDRRLVADAVQTRFLARSLEDRRLVLLSGLDEATVEDLEFGFAEDPDALARLVRRASSVVFLHEADRMLPSIA